MNNKPAWSAWRKWTTIALIVTILLSVVASAAFIYLSNSQRLGPRLISAPGAGQGDSAKQDQLDSLRSLPYVAWTDEDVSDTQKGVITHDKNKALAGYNIYTNDVDQVFIMNMDGRIVHSWSLPGKRHCEYAEFLDDGTVLVICESESIVKLDWSGKVLWETPAAVNHDVAVLPDGSSLVPVMERFRSYNGMPGVRFDSIMSISADGKPLYRWSTFTNLASLQAAHEPLPLDSPTMADDKEARNRLYDYYHLNTIELLPDTVLGQKDHRFQAGNILLSLRNANVIVILDKDTMELQWSWGPGELDFPHMPTMIENGNLLIFDNGTHRSYSRVLELDPARLEIVWEYKASPPTEFHSKWRGSNQRLPNGNTLICDSESGRVFEVTYAGEIVWDFWNPEIKKKKRKRIYRMMRLPSAKVDRFLQN